MDDGWRRPDLPDGPLRALNDALHELHARTGHRSSRWIAGELRERHGRGAPSHTKIHQMFTSPELPRPELLDWVVAVLAERVRGLDPDTECDRLAGLWNHAFDDRRNRRRTPRPTPAPTLDADPTVDAGPIPPANTPASDQLIDPVHAVALAGRPTIEAKIRYACERVDPPTVLAVQQWLDTYGVTTARSYATSVVGTWQREQQAADTSPPANTPASNLLSDTVHAIALASRITIEAKILYACEQVHPPTVLAVQQWLDTYGVTTARSYATKVIDTWQRKHQAADTGTVATSGPGPFAAYFAPYRDLTSSQRHDQPLSEELEHILFQIPDNLLPNAPTLPIDTIHTLLGHYTTLLAIRQHALDRDHPHTLNVRHNLAYWRGRAGKAAAAATELDKLLSDRMRVLGPDHPHTLTTRHTLAHYRGEAGDVSGAAAAFAELLHDQTRVLGPDHPDTLATRHSQASWQGEAGDASGAAAAFAELLHDQTRVLG
ncbi:tetratricopeptide repeat protein, partial [Actinokineospora sp. PR83]|uniref:tetratricopeptide repeat protein n=1 Tax=Actinokineospora sp. PR83 TaxID=2884908 RepID=UPI0027E186B0